MNWYFICKHFFSNVQLLPFWEIEWHQDTDSFTALYRYNCVSLGLFILAVAMLDRSCVLSGAVAFSLALNYKQMELYHAMPFFVYILGSSLFSSESFLRKYVCNLNFMFYITCSMYMVTGSSKKSVLVQVYM